MLLAHERLDICPVVSRIVQTCADDTRHRPTPDVDQLCLTRLALNYGNRPLLQGGRFGPGLLFDVFGDEACAELSRVLVDLVFREELEHVRDVDIPEDAGRSLRFALACEPSDQPSRS